MTRVAVRVALSVAIVTGLVSACEHAVSSLRGPAQSGATRSAQTLPGAAAMERYLAGLTAAGRFSGTVLVARGGHVLLRNGYGLADRATRMPNGPGTVFQIGSVTKQFTAMAIAMLAAQGRLRLTGRACAYLPGCPRSWLPVTIDELLTHTSGIANWSTWPFTKLPVVHAACPYTSCPLPVDQGYGYGWFVGGGPDGKVVHHSGSVLGFWSYNGFYPTRDTVVVILSNLDTVQINPISAELNELAQARGSL
ncbi:MAG TPA: serine hydrolase domain-containing protein [Streptosporangiaceae bacterium]|nr:serine hydrolase domain-containing protein [Streptosporangiaceae bacterium]